MSLTQELLKCQSWLCWRPLGRVFWDLLLLFLHSIDNYWTSLLWQFFLWSGPCSSFGSPISWQSSTGGQKSWIGLRSCFQNGSLERLALSIVPNVSKTEAGWQVRGCCFSLRRKDLNGQGLSSSVSLHACLWIQLYRHSLGVFSMQYSCDQILMCACMRVCACARVFSLFFFLVETLYPLSSKN